MKINSISNTTNIINNNYKNQSTKNYQHAPIYKTEQRDITTFNRTNAMFLNFNGGASLNLKATIENLEFLGAAFKKAETIFPPRVRETANELINGGNPLNKRLIDIHKDIFGEIKECETLSEIKALFSEEHLFDKVLSDSEVKFSEGSFADIVKKGENQYFDKDEDLSVQILKLYWGEGFSLSDLKTYTGGKDINYLLNRLRIPKRDKHYGAYLKLSDEEYNARITSEMAAKRLESLDKKAQALEGEPVYIPRRPLSELHKQHISEGLIRYYQENPIACYSISKRQKEFYEKNPEQKLIFQEVLKRAWALKSADNIKYALRKHLSRFGIKNFSPELLSSPLSFDEKLSIAMKKFWADNEWACKAHSKNMQYAWRTVKEDLNNPEIILNYPVGLVKDIQDFAKTRGVTLKLEDFVTEYNTVTKKHMYNEKFFGIYSDFVNESNNADIIASLYQYSLVKSIRNLAAGGTPANKKSRKALLDFLTKKYQDQIYDLDPKTGNVIGFKDLNIDQSRTIFINVQRDLRRLDTKLEEDFLRNLSLDYPIIKEEGLKYRK